VFWIRDANGRFVYVGPAYEKIWGRSIEKLYADPDDFIEAVIPEQRKREVRKIVNDMSRSDEVFDEEFQIKQPEGGIRWIRARSFPVVENGVIVKRVGTAEDITEKKITQKELIESEEKYRTLFENTSHGVVIVDENSRCVDCNDAALRIFGLFPEQKHIALGMAPWEASPERQPNGKKSASLGKEYVNQALIHGPVWFEWMHQKFDGDLLPVEIWLSPIHSDRKTLIQAVIIDITKRKAAEKYMSELYRQLIKTREIERKMISGYLHDRVAQDLLSVKIAVEHLDDEYANNFKRKIEKLSVHIQQTINAVRDMAYDLRPVGLEQLGLVKSLYIHCEDFSSKTKIPLDFKATGIEEGMIDYETKINLFRIVQEALTNIKKHAKARQVVLRLAASFPNVILRIEDDGGGFDVGKRTIEAMEEKRMGLAGMKELAGMMNGSLTVTSKIGKYTKIVMEAPVLGGYIEPANNPNPDH
jgi:PAS domain S-box-containing protein